MEENVTINLETPILIIFAEYLGYVSMYVNIAEEWCDGRVPQIQVQKLMIIEASNICRQMKIDYTLEDIKMYYLMYKDVILQEYEEKLANIVKK